MPVLTIHSQRLEPHPWCAPSNPKMIPSEMRSTRNVSDFRFFFLKFGIFANTLWDFLAMEHKSKNEIYIFSLSLSSHPHLFLSQFFHLGEDVFQDSLKNGTWQVSFLRTLMTEHVFIILIFYLWLARYKMLNSPAFILSSCHSTQLAENLSATPVSSPSRCSISFVHFTCVYDVDSCL